MIADAESTSIMTDANQVILYGPPGSATAPTTEQICNMYYVPNLAPYIVALCHKTGVHHEAAYSKVVTSLFTLQAVWRGHSVRKAIRRQQEQQQISSAGL